MKRWRFLSFPGPIPYAIQPDWEYADLLFEDETIQPIYSQDGNWISFSYDTCLYGSPLYFSPDSQTAVFFGDESSSGFILRDGIESMIRYAPERSVEDTYGVIKKFRTMISNQWAGVEGLAWSPDGRYAVITNRKRLLENFQFIYGLYVIDTQTSELLCLDTYPRTPFEESASVLMACFDNTGQNLYYFVYGPLSADDGDILSLLRYNMETGEKEKLYGSRMDIAFPKMQIDSQGRIWAIRNYLQSSDEYAGLNLYQANEGAWTKSTFSLSLPAKAVRPYYMEIVNDTGVALAYIDSLNKSDQYSLPMRFFLAEAPEQFDELLLISSFDDTEASVLRLSDDSIEDTLEAFYRSDGLKCLNIRLSPNGQYAMLLMRDAYREYGYLMLDVHTLALSRVNAPDGHASPFAGLDYAGSKSYPAGFNWYSGNRFVLNTESGPALYTLALD